MITLEKLRIYEKYGGDIDHLARMQNESDLKTITTEDWAQIGGLIQDMGMENKNLISESYREKIKRRLENETDNQETMQELKRLTGKFYSKE